MICFVVGVVLFRYGMMWYLWFSGYCGDVIDIGR